DISTLKSFKSLTHLNLNTNKIVDISVLKNLPLLTNLILSDNEIINISSIKNLTLLEYLDLWCNQISDISFLQELEFLKILNLSYNNISDISALKNLDELISLNLWGNNISDISALQDLVLLKNLNLWSNEISDISILESLVLLENLELGINNISDISVLENLKKLTSLDLSSNEITDISILHNLPLLKRLKLNSNVINDISIISNLKLLIDLNLGINKISDISILKELMLLESLYIHHNDISDISILNELTLLRELNFSNNNIKDISLLENLKLLTTLNVSNNPISNISAIGNLPNLKNIYLAGIDCDNFAVLKDMLNLNELHISNNNISNLYFLENLINLKVLDISCNKILQLNFLQDLKKLTKIYLNSNEISDIEEFQYFDPLPSYIEIDGNPCFDSYDLKFEKKKNHHDLILNLLKKINEEKKEYVLPTKVLLLGNTGCGKSTLLDYILQDKKNKAFKNNLASTHIIQVETFPKKLKRNSIPEAVFYDFGGQDYYHGLYKAFLSNESLNILLWNNQNDENQVRKDRNEQFTRDYDRNYWLYQLKFQYDKKNSKELNKGTEPIILIQTHADNELSRRETYQGNCYDFNIINEFYLSFDSASISQNKTLDIGLRYFEETLHEQIKQKQIKKYEPIWYKNFLNYILRSTKKSYINLSDLASEYKRDSDLDNKLLPEVLREIAQTGLILYYKDDKDLKDVAWLNPSGIIEDIHDRVLSKDSIKKNKGIVQKDFFDNLIKDEKLIKLLVNQKVIFLDEYDNNYIIPGYLPLTEEEDKLYELLTFDFIEPNFIMKYEHFIPFGLINQLVCFYGKGKSKKHYWRDQLLFTKGNSKILIKLDFTNLEILVSIKSKDSNARIEKIQQEIFTDILDIYWDKNDKYKILEYIQPKYYKFHDFDGENIDKFKNVSINIEKFDIKHFDVDHLNVDMLDKVN
ncbi:leucine-rich repeat domain-containing protein, partial [Flavobacterium artemisiae]